GRLVGRVAQLHRHPGGRGAGGGGFRRLRSRRHARRRDPRWNAQRGGALREGRRTRRDQHLARAVQQLDRLARRGCHGARGPVARVCPSDRVLCSSRTLYRGGHPSAAPDLARAAAPVRMKPRVYLDAPMERPGEVSLDDAPAHHLARVLRLREGDALTVFNGRGGEWDAQFVGKRRVRLVGFDAVERESPLRITLVQGVSSGDRMDYTVQKAVELGVAAIQPLITKKGIVRLEGARASARVEHWRKIAIAACEQCGRNRIPEVLPLIAFHQYRPEGDATRLLLSAQGRSLREIKMEGAAAIAAGAEAGFAAEEQAALERAGFVKASLGPRVLRTETAALAALAALNALQGDF